MPNRFELAAQFNEVVDFSVEDDRNAAVRTEHGLVPSERQIEDRQAPKTKRYAVPEFHTMVIRTSMPDDRSHALDEFELRRLGQRADQRDEATHRWVTGNIARRCELNSIAGAP